MKRHIFFAAAAGLALAACGDNANTGAQDETTGAGDTYASGSTAPTDPSTQATPPADPMTTPDTTGNTPGTPPPDGATNGATTTPP